MQIHEPTPRDPCAGDRRPALERFLNAAHTVAASATQSDDESQDIMRHGIEEIRRALPVAQQVLLTSHVLDSVSNALDAYILARQAEAEAGSGPGDIDLVCAAERDAVYFVGVTLGLLLSEAL